MGLVDNDKNAALADDMYNVGNNASTNVSQGGTKEEEPEQPAQPSARTERKLADEDVSNEMHDHTNPFNRRVGVMPDDIADHDTNKGTENDKLSDEAKTDEDGKGDKYKGIRDIVDQLREYADSEEEKMNLSDEEKSKKKREEKRRMLMSGMADAANAFHRAYSYARGIKAMEGSNKDYSKDAKKEMREDEEWYNKNRDRIMNYRAKAADLERTYAALLNQDRLRDQQEAAQQYRYDRLKLDIQKAADTKSLNEKKLEIQEMLALGRINKMQHDMLMDELDKQIKQQNANTATARENRMSQGSTTTTTKVDATGLPTTTTQVRQYGTGSTSGNSNAGTSKGTGYGKQSKGTGYDK